MKLERVKVYTVDEVAYTLRVSSETVYRMIRKGEIRALKVGRNYRIPEQSLVHFFRKEYGSEELYEDSKGDSGPGERETRSIR